MDRHTYMLGGTYQDAISGFRGVCTAIVYHIGGLTRAELTAPATANGEVRELWFDVDRLSWDTDAPSVEMPYGASIKDAA